MNFRFPFHLQCAIYKPHRSEGSKPPGRSHDCWLGCCASVLPYAQSSKQNILFYFPVSPVYLTQLIHISLQKVNVELQLLIILWLKCGKAINHSHRMFSVGRDPKNHQAQPLCHRQGHVPPALFFSFRKSTLRGWLDCHLPGYIWWHGFAESQLCLLYVQKAVEKRKWCPDNPSFQIFPSTCKFYTKKDVKRKRRRKHGLPLHPFFFFYLKHCTGFRRSMLRLQLCCRLSVLPLDGYCKR